MKDTGRKATVAFHAQNCAVAHHAYTTKLNRGDEQVQSSMRTAVYTRMITDVTKQKGPGVDWAYLHVLDIESLASIDDTQLMDTIAAIAAMAQLNPSVHGVFIAWPMPNGKVGGAKAAKQRRNIEDALIKASLSPEFNTAFKFKESEHGRDARPCTMWCSMAMVDRETNVFASSDMAQGRTTTDEERLIRLKDMAVAEIPPEDAALPCGITNKEFLHRPKLQTLERLRQRGMPITTKMICDCVNGASLTPRMHLVILEYFPTAAVEFTNATRHLSLRQMSGTADATVHINDMNITSENPIKPISRNL